MKIKSFFEQHKSNYWFWAFVIVAVVLFIVIPLMSLDVGNSGDEDGFQIPQGENILNYFRTGGEDTTCLTFANLKYYGSSFDLIMAFYNDTFHVENIHHTRHIFNSFFGWLAILFAGLIAVRIGGWRAGLFSMLLLFLSPRFLGHSFNNPKDIPFATAVIVSIYLMFRFFEQFPKVKWYTVVLLILSIAFSISIRIGGMILFGYFAFFGLLYLIKIANENKKKFLLQTKNAKSTKSKKSIKKEPILPPKFIGKLLLYGICICVAGYFIGLLLWPYALQSPIKNPMEAFGAMSKFAIGIKQNFEGALQWSDALPWYYTPKYILITIPIAVIIGIILYPFVGGWQKEKRLSTFMLYFISIFPIFWIVYTNANVYGGWRHTIFAYPPMAVIAGLSFSSLIDFMNKKIYKIIFSFVPLLLLIHPIKHIITNHPFEYIYFNEFMGSFKNVYGNYEMDYYQISTRQASEWILENIKSNKQQNGEKIKIGAWHSPSVAYYFRNDTTLFKPIFIRWYESGNYDWDYAIFPITGINSQQIKGKFFPPKNTIHTINLNEKPICLILKRDDKSDFIGNNFKTEKQIDSAIYYFEKALTVDPHNLSALLNLAEIFLMTNQVEDAKTLIDRYLEVDPDSENGNYFLAYYYINKQQINEAIRICKKIIHDNFKFSSAYLLATQLYIQQGNINQAEKMLLKMMEKNVINDDGVALLIQIYKNQGLNEQQAYRKMYKIFRDKYEKEGDKEKYKLFNEYYMQTK